MALSTSFRFLPLPLPGLLPLVTSHPFPRPCPSPKYGTHLDRLSLSITSFTSYLFLSSSILKSNSDTLFFTFGLRLHQPKQPNRHNSPTKQREREQERRSAKMLSGGLLTHARILLLEVTFRLRFSPILSKPSLPLPR